MFKMVAILAIVHGIDGREILLNPESVTNMKSAIEGKENAIVAGKVQCIINMSDGHFISVVESCKQVEWIIRRAEAAEKEK
jgi:hypothetical protein